MPLAHYYNFIYQLLHQVGEIEVQTGKYQGFINGYWLEFLDEILPQFIIHQVRLVTINREGFVDFVSDLNLNDEDEDEMFEYVHNHLNFLANILSPEYPINRYPNLDLHYLKLCPQNLVPYDSLESRYDTVDTYRSFRDWIIHSPHLREISMANSPQFKRLTGWKFISEANILADLFEYEIVDELRSRAVIHQSIVFDLFLPDIIRVFDIFPNLTEVYFLTGWSSPEWIKDRLTRLVTLYPSTNFIIFLNDANQAKHYANYFINYTHLRFVLV